jgi:ATP-dependent RNA helicase RhlE
LNSSFESLGLLPDLVRAVHDEGYTAPTPIQIQAIPPILQGRDILAAAQTGTGKTAGFALPLLQRLTSNPHRAAPKSPRALILAPTRELAAQVESAIRTYGKHLKLTTAVVFGGVGMQPQVDRLKRGIDVLVATPGRLLDHAQQHTVDLSKVEILVLDEADRMLDMGFIHDIKRVLKLMPAKKQSLLFSATFSEEIRALATGLIHNPVTVEVARRNAPADIVAQSAYMVAKERKRELLRDLVVDGNWQQVLVFTRMKHGANRLAEQLNKDGLAAAAIHGNKSQNARTKALAGFKANEVRVLVATDIAARGLDIEGLPHVVNYELPNVPEDYVHRIGRTGRAGVPGHAVSLVSSDEAEYLRDIEKLLKKPIERLQLPADFATRAPSARLAAGDAERAPRPRPQRPQRPQRGAHPAPRREERTTGHAPRTPVTPSRPKVNSPRPQQTAGQTPAARPARPPQQDRRGGPSVAAPSPSRADTEKTRHHEPRQAPRRGDRAEPQTVRSNLPPHLQGAFRRGR